MDDPRRNNLWGLVGEPAPEDHRLIVVVGTAWFGYRDLGDAHKALANTLKTGTVPAHMRHHLGTALELDETVIDSVVESTSRQRQDEWRAWLLTEEKERMARFQPHLRTETARTV